VSVFVSASCSLSAFVFVSASVPVSAYASVSVSVRESVSESVSVCVCVGLCLFLCCFFCLRLCLVFVSVSVSASVSEFASVSVSAVRRKPYLRSRPLYKRQVSFGSRCIMTTPTLPLYGWKVFHRMVVKSGKRLLHKMGAGQSER
jgi:hypothetical protein